MTIRAIVVIFLLIRFNHVKTQISAPPRLTLSNGGSMQGTYFYSAKGDLIHAFLGIPYAEPPTGPLRFSDPIPKFTWRDTLQADRKPNACIQYNVGDPTALAFGSEDCLYLNVYTPKTRSPSAKLPVMVWIHGGAYYIGSSDPQAFGPELLLDFGVILVTFNYRLGALGFLSTGTIDAPGNFGLKDQNVVLKWIQQFIKDFGGDPDNVTLFGQSAGAASVSFHMVSPKSSGLFHKAILQSGSLYSPWSMVSQKQAVLRAKQIAESLGCSTENPAEVVDCLRHKDAGTIIKAQLDYFVFPTYDPVVIFAPVIEPQSDAAFLDKDPRKYKKPYGDSIPVIIGALTGDGLVRSAPIIDALSEPFIRDFDLLLPTILFYDNLSQEQQEAQTRKIAQFYLKNGFDWSRENSKNLTDIFSDRFFFAGMEQFLKDRLRKKKRAENTYAYIYDHNSPRSSTTNFGVTDYYGVSHEDELPMLFPFGQYGLRNIKRNRQMKWALPRMWTDFAKYGDPTPDKSKITEKWRRATRFPFQYALIGSQYIPYEKTLDLSVVGDEVKSGEYNETNADDSSPNIERYYGRENSQTYAYSVEEKDVCRVYTRRGPCQIIENRNDRFWSGFYIKA